MLRNTVRFKRSIIKLSQGDACSVDEKNDLFSRLLATEHFAFNCDKKQYLFGFIRTIGNLRNSLIFAIESELVRCFEIMAKYKER